jgi:S-adenosyl-L-methionine hydrolase (adenosine-forming)
MPTITLLTDFGTDDYYVAAVKGVLLRLAPGSTLVDVTHSVAPGDVEGAAWLLAAAARWHAAGTVHLAVVDPGVGSARGILALRAGGSFFVAPDNGLLTPILDGAPGSWEAAQGGWGSGVEAHEIRREDVFLPGPGATFHGRDRFAPVAAWLARGEELAALGPRRDDPVRLAAAPPRAEGTPPIPGTAGAVLHGRVVHVDRFGNLITDLPAEWLGEARCEAEVEVRGATHRTPHRAAHYAAIPPGEAAVLPGSLGTLELSLDGAGLAERWDVVRGARVTVRVLPHLRG